MFTDLLKQNGLALHEAWFTNTEAVKLWVDTIGNENKDDGASHNKNTEIQSIRKQWYLSNQRIIHMIHVKAGTYLHSYKCKHLTF